MSQHDYVIDNASGATVRADINSALSAIQSLNSGTSAPSSTAAGMLWLDTTGGAPYALKVRDAGNNHWLTLASITDPGSDGNLSVAAIEGTSVLSTGESGGSKFLREDGDGTCSFQTISSFTFDALIVFNGTSGTPSALASVNVSSVTRISTGAYDINWDTDFSNTNYYLLTTASNTDATACRLAIPRVVATDKVQINVMNNDAVATDAAEHITVAAFTQ